MEQSNKTRGHKAVSSTHLDNNTEMAHKTAGYSATWSLLETYQIIIT